jgi:hypothetical protein
MRSLGVFKTREVSDKPYFDAIVEEVYRESRALLTREEWDTIAAFQKMKHDVQEVFLLLLRHVRDLTCKQSILKAFPQVQPAHLGVLSQAGFLISGESSIASNLYLILFKMIPDYITDLA